ncbi:hypothetical protein [Mycobacteroides abscessus]|uniref:hypothetical protein n=1 Tax=Mycobacteroides abscessus TaxID=36809 RepID=UPI00119F455E|nr:hypothetical protein [Mycobacteroides abscessus]
MTRIGRYHLFGSDDDPDLLPDLIVLDQNVCLHIKGFYFGESREYNEDLRELLLTFPYSRFLSATHITSGWAIEENAWSRSGEFNALNKRKVQWATEKVLSWEPKRVEFEFTHRTPPGDRDRKWAKGVPIPEQGAHPLQGLIMSYAPMLRLCSLFAEAKRRGGQAGRLWAFDQFNEWMLNDFGYLLSYEGALAAQALLGEGNQRNAARGLFHLSGNESPDEVADKTWAAAWDMQYARLVDFGPAGLMQIANRKFRKVAVVTEDTDPFILKSRAQLQDTIGTSSIYTMPSDVEIPESKYVEDFGYGISLLKRTSPRPPGADPFKALDTLERSMGVERRTISAFVRCPGGISSALLATLKQLDARKSLEDD